MSTEENLLHRISKKNRQLSPALRSIAQVILSNPSHVQTLSISQLAELAEVADSTVSRFLREFDIDGFKSLRLGIARAIYGQGSLPTSSGAGYVYEGILQSDEPRLVFEKVHSASQEALQRTADGLNAEQINEVADLIAGAGTFYLLAMGSSAIAAENAVMRFTRAGVRCLLHKDQSVQVMASATATADDLVLAISDSGMSTPIVNSARVAALHGAKVVAITSAINSELALMADYVLLTHSTRASSDVYGETVTSKWGQLLVVDALYAAFAVKNYESTSEFLRESYLSGIKDTRSNQ